MQTSRHNNKNIKNNLYCNIYEHKLLFSSYLVSVVDNNNVPQSQSAKQSKSPWQACFLRENKKPKKKP